MLPSHNALVVGRLLLHFGNVWKSMSNMSVVAALAIACGNPALLSETVHRL